MAHIDLNSDLGESFGPWPMGDDAAMLDIVTSANVACGFHAGDPAGILTTLQRATERGVAVGAHPGYRDLVGFGRRNMTPSADELTADVIYQIGALQALARAAGTKVRYVKPHGALYNTIAQDPVQAAAVIEALTRTAPDLPLMALAGSPIVEQARKAGLTVICEAFADRAYLPNGALAPRSLAGSVIHDPELISARILRMINEQVIEAVDGTLVPIEAQSICVHGDNSAAVAIAGHLRSSLTAAGVTLKAFAEPASA